MKEKTMGITKKATFIDHHYVKNWMLENTECELIGGRYKNAHSIMDFRCSCGGDFSADFAYFKYRKNRKTCYGCKKLALDVDYFKEIDSPEKAFWLGLICADGAISTYGEKGSGKFRFAITQKEPGLLNLLKEDLGYEGKLKLVEGAKGRYSDKPFYRLDISRLEFVDNLLDSGKSRYKDEQKHIPKSVREELKRDFIRGFFEGDGTIYYDKHQRGYCSGLSGRYEILMDIKSFLGVGGSIQKDKSIYKIGLTKNQTKMLIEKIYYKGFIYGNKNSQYVKNEGVFL